MADPEVYVLDQGGVHNPALRNYDHHQLPADHTPACTLTLILSDLGVSTRQARVIWDWLSFAELIDSKGPSTTAKHYGVSPDALHSMLSPVEGAVLRLFASREFITLEPTGPLAMTGYLDLLPQLMLMIGKDCIDRLHKVVGRIELLKEQAKFYDVEGFLVCDLTNLPRGSEAALGLDLFFKEMNIHNCAVTLSNGEHVNGLCLFRRGDNPNINFAHLEGQKGVYFAHKNGFICKFDNKLDPIALIRKSLTKREASNATIL